MRIDFSRGRVLVLGDLMLDRYYFGSVNRISPEAPVPVVKVTRTLNTLGGAGNVGNNLSHLGAPVTVVGIVGSDENGRLLSSFCKKNGIVLVPVFAPVPTTTKIRVIGEHQQIVRVDFEETPPVALSSGIMTTIMKELKKASVVILSDYGKGFCSVKLCRFVLAEARKRKIPVIVDPKGHDWTKYRGASFITPNVKELSDVAGHVVENQDRPVAGFGRKILTRYRLGHLLVTRSEKGMSLISAGKVVHAPTEAQEVFDVSGAGDTVVATLAAALANNYQLAEALLLANKAAGIVVGKMGTVPIEIAELRAAVSE
jgi:D-beta-D-heptose 7-phosphate kinase/D-beta-D-heptose 1-phosphate adenosyltransferase